MKILLAGPRGFCAGVNMAIEALERALTALGAPLYVFHEIVHNSLVVGRFRERGVVFVDSVDEVPIGGRLMYSAHGVSPDVERQARARGLTVIDATCPLVRKVHLEAVRFARGGYTIILIGHAGHDEVVGTLGEAPERIVLVETPDDVDRLELPQADRVAYLTQTTLSVDDAGLVIARILERYPQAVGPVKEDICYATQNRQEALKALLPECDAALVVGSPNSSNSARLAEVARSAGCQAWLVDDASQIDPAWLKADYTVAVTAGASAPEELVTACVARLRELFGAEVEERTLRTENFEFPLPLAVR